MTDPSSLLSSSNHHWTGDPDTDRANLITRARIAAPHIPPPNQQSALPGPVDVVITIALIVLLIGIALAASS
jgi:hypothetical protein